MISEQDIRFAAEALLRSGNAANSSLVQSPTLDLSHSQSINTITSMRPEYVISEDLLAGQRLNGNMSSVRRFFCLFVTFDLLFTSLMWLTCVMLNGENITTALRKQIYEYDIHNSLFDIVLAAACRFTVLLLFYALLYINHWIIICISTAGTCAFLVAKVFVYDWPHSRQPVFEVLLVLTSFVLSWGETWFLDFKVLPQEFHARRYLVGSVENERTPLLRNYVQNLPSMYTESVGNFYSPLCSPEGSVHTMDCRQRYPPMRLTLAQEEAYRLKSTETFNEVWSLLHKSNWKLEKESHGDEIHSFALSANKKIFRLTGEVDVSPRFLLDELFYKIESLPQWNSSVLESHKVQAIDEHTDICYQISADGGKGLVSSRDFVTLRYWNLIDECYLIASVGTEHPSLPKNERYIRGENGIGCWVMRPIDGGSNKCTFQWVLNTNLNGWFPPYILHTAFMNLMFQYIRDLREHVTKLKSSERLA